MEGGGGQGGMEREEGASTTADLPLGSCFGYESKCRGSFSPSAILTLIYCSRLQEGAEGARLSHFVFSQRIGTLQVKISDKSKKRVCRSHLSFEY